MWQLMQTLSLVLQFVDFFIRCCVYQAKTPEVFKTSSSLSERAHFVGQGRQTGTDFDQKVVQQ
jgi:hypothetical protein